MQIFHSLRESSRPLKYFENKPWKFLYQSVILHFSFLITISPLFKYIASWERFQLRYVEEMLFPESLSCQQIFVYSSQCFLCIFVFVLFNIATLCEESQSLIKSKQNTQASMRLYQCKTTAFLTNQRARSGVTIDTKFRLI